MRKITNKRHEMNRKSIIIRYIVVGIHYFCTLYTISCFVFGDYSLTRTYATVFTTIIALVLYPIPVFFKKLFQ